MISNDSIDSFHSRFEWEWECITELQSPDTAKWRLATCALTICANATDSSPNASVTIRARPRRLPARQIRSEASANTTFASQIHSPPHISNSISYLFSPILLFVWMTVLCVAIFFSLLYSLGRHLSYLFRVPILSSPAPTPAYSILHLHVDQIYKTMRYFLSFYVFVRSTACKLFNVEAVRRESRVKEMKWKVVVLEDEGKKKKE